MSSKKNQVSGSSISSLFSSGSGSTDGLNALSSLFQEENRTKFSRAMKPAEFEVKKKSSEMKDSKKIKKPKHKKRRREEELDSTLAGTACMDTTAMPAVADAQDAPFGVTGVDERTIFAGNLPLSASVKTLKKYFREFGVVESLRLRSVPIAGVAVDEKGNQNLVKKVCSNSRMFGDQKGSFNSYVVFATAEAATAALSANNRVLDGRHIRVDRVKATHFDPKLTLFLGSLPHYTDEEELRDFFAKKLPNGQDDIENLRLIRDPETLVGKGIGYLLLKNQDAIIRVLSLTQEKFKKREIRISACGKRTKRTEKKRKLEETSITEQTGEVEGSSAKKAKTGDNEKEAPKRTKSVSVEARNAIAATKRVLAKMEKAKQKFIKKKKTGAKPKINSGKKSTTKQLGGVIKRAIKAANNATK